jgi:hypothetical protein
MFVMMANFPQDETEVSLNISDEEEIDSKI